MTDDLTPTTAEARGLAERVQIAESRANYIRDMLIDLMEANGGPFDRQPRISLSGSTIAAWLVNFGSYSGHTLKPFSSQTPSTTAGASGDVEALIGPLAELLAKAAETPWFVHDFREVSSAPSVRDIVVSCTTPDHIGVAYMDRALTAHPEEALANAALMVAAVNALPQIFTTLRNLAAENERDVQVVKDLLDAWPDTHLPSNELCQRAGSIVNRSPK